MKYVEEGMNQDTRYDQIIETATELFHEKGYEQSSVRDIAAKLGMKSGSLYNYISSKQEILYKIIMRVGNEFIRSAQEVLNESATAEEKMHALIRNHIQVLHEHKNAVTVYFQEWRKLDVDLQEKIIQPREQYKQIFKAVIREGMEKGEFAEEDLNMAVLVVLSTVNWTYQWYQKEGPLPHNEIADKFTDIVLHGLKKR